MAQTVTFRFASGFAYISRFSLLSRSPFASFPLSFASCSPLCLSSLIAAPGSRQGGGREVRAATSNRPVGPAEMVVAGVAGPLLLHAL